MTTKLRPSLREMMEGRNGELVFSCPFYSLRCSVLNISPYTNKKHTECLHFRNGIKKFLLKPFFANNSILP